MLRGERPAAAENRKLAAERRAVGVEVTIGGVPFVITFGFYADDTIGEVFIRTSRKGATDETPDEQGEAVAGPYDAWATMLSIALQHGVPWDLVCAKGRHHRFSPQGFTSHPLIPNAKSVVDFVCHWIELYMQRWEKRHAERADAGPGAPAGEDRTPDPAADADHRDGVDGQGVAEVPAVRAGDPPA